jgi:hypothetical protein
MNEDLMRSIPSIAMDLVADAPKDLTMALSTHDIANVLTALAQDISAHDPDDAVQDSLQDTMRKLLNAIDIAI